MKKLFYSLLLVFCMVFTLFPSMTFAGDTTTAVWLSSNTHVAKYNGTGTLTITDAPADIPNKGDNTYAGESIGKATIPSDNPAIRDGKNAIIHVLDLNQYANMKVMPDKNYDRSNPVAQYNAGDILGYKYLAFEKDNSISSGLDFTKIAKGTKCTDSNVGSKVAGMSPHVHVNGKPCWVWDWTSDGGNAVLTLNNIDIRVPKGDAITVPSSAEIVLEDGSINTVSSAGANGIVTPGTTTISGGGTLNIPDAGNGIFAQGTLTISDSVINVTSRAHAIYSANLHISGGTVTANVCGSTAAVRWLTDATFNGMKIMAKTGNDTDYTTPAFVNTSGMDKYISLGSETTATPATDVRISRLMDSHIITFNANGGNVTPATAESGADGKLDSLPTPTRSGYRFVGWFTTADGGDQVTTNTVFASDTTVYAHWKARGADDSIYTISFDTTGGSVSPVSATTDADGRLPSLPTPIREHYRFDGWFTAPIGGTRVTTETVFTKDTTIYAHWTATGTDDSIYTISFDTNGGIVSPLNATTNADGKLPSLPTPTRKQYRFDGWFTAPIGGIRVTINTVFTRDTTIYAHWSYIPSNPSNGRPPRGGGTAGGGPNTSDSNSSNGGLAPGMAAAATLSATSEALTQIAVTVEATVDANGNGSVSITDQNIADAIAKAEAVAKKNGTTADLTIVLHVTGGKGASSITVDLPKSVQDTLLLKKVWNTIFLIDHPGVQIGMDLQAVMEMNRQAQSDVGLQATRLNSNTLTGSAKTAIGTRSVFDFKVSYGNGQQVQSFGNGNMSVGVPYFLGTNEKDGNVIAVYADANGNAQWLTSSVYDSTAKLLRFSTNHFSTYGVGYKIDVSGFTDIASHTAQEDILFAVSRGLMTGTSNTAFQPNATMTRGTFVTALGRLANANVSGYTKSSFSDVKAGSDSMGYIEWASKNGILTGSNGKFFPDQSVTREQMAVILQNYAKVMQIPLPKVYEVRAFADNGKISSYAKDAVQAMQVAGVIRSKNGNVFDPQGTVTRAEVCTMLRRFVEVRIGADTAQGLTRNDSGKWMYYENGKAVTGTKDVGGVSYTFDQYGEAVDVPKRLSYVTHTVKVNESWGLIAKQYGCSAIELATANVKTVFDVIHPGDVLKVPQK